MRRLIACTMLACVSGLSSAHAASLPVTVIAARSVDSNETYSGTTVVLAGTVTVNATLDLENDQIEATPGTDVVVNGTLEIGSSQWSGFASTLEAPGVLRASDFTADQLGITITGSAVLDRVRLSNGQSDLIDVMNGSLDATSLTLDTASQSGIRASNSSVTIHSATISKTSGYALSTDGGTFDASGLNVTSPNDYGLWSHAGSVKISSSSFAGDCGIYLGPSTTGSVDGVSFTTANHGLMQYETGAVSLSNLSFNGEVVGLTVIGSTISAGSINAHSTSIGIEATNSSGSISGGTLAGSTGVQINGSYDLAPMIRNLDLSAATIGVDNQTTTTADARYNYWGGAPSVNGPVLTSPWLSTPP
ncbi:MAG: hypothetical protein ACYDCC_14640 [Actinomycetota bacterium]